jgi:hypothetical protein
MNWTTITVQQFQQIDLVRKEAKSDDLVADINTRLLAIILNRTEDDIDSLPLVEYRELCKQLEFLETDIPETDPVKYLNIGGNRYRMIYDVQQMPFARYIESKAFAGDFVANLHKIAASMVIPQKRNYFRRWKDAGYNAAHHINYANDLQKAPFIAIYNSAVFFYHVYRNWIEVSKDYLIVQIQKAGKSLAEAERQVEDLCSSLDGSIAVRLLPTGTISRLRRPITSQLLRQSTQ